MSDQHELSPEERARVTLQVEYFINLVERRYGMSAGEVAEAVRWVARTRDRNGKLAQAGAVQAATTVAEVDAVVVSWP